MNPKGIILPYNGSSQTEKWFGNVIEAISTKCRAKMDMNFVTHLMLITLGSKRVAGAFLSVTSHHCVVLSHTAMEGSTYDYENYLVLKMQKEFSTNGDIKRVFGVYRVEVQDTEDETDTWLTSEFDRCFKRGFKVAFDKRRNKSVKRGKEMEILYQRTGIQQVWFSPYTRFKFYIPDGFTAPERQPTLTELGDIKKRISIVKDQSRAEVKINDTRHKIVLLNIFLEQLEAIKGTLPLVAPTTPGKKKKKNMDDIDTTRSVKTRKKSYREEDNSDEDENSNEDEESEESYSDDDDDNDGDNDGDDDGEVFSAEQQNTLPEPDDYFSSDDEIAPEENIPVVKPKSNKKKMEKRKKKKMDDDDDDDDKVSSASKRRRSGSGAE